MLADPSAPLRVLLIEDNPDDALLVQHALAAAEQACFTVTVAPTLRDGVQILESGHHDAVLLDLSLPGSRGLKTLDRIRQQANTMPIVVLSGLDDEALAIEALGAGAQDFLVKGHYDPTQLGRAVRYAVERKRAQDEIDAVNKRLRTRVRHRTSQLEIATEDLQSFIHGITHDLRTPLRSIHGFSELLLEEYGGRLDATGHDYLRRLGEASERLETLLNALQTLAQLNRTTLRWEHVNLSQLAERATREQIRRYPEMSMTINIDPDLRAVGDPRLLRMAFGHLFSNAWKFSCGVEAPVVTVGQIDGAFFVRDNGVGFDMAFSGNLFKPFQRLHADEDFRGTGMGLATTWRIIHRHGGRLWAESAPGEGATFFFTLESRLPGEPLI
jgi:signal transduction histidine kinase